jgi:hypothetical protein
LPCERVQVAASAPRYRAGDFIAYDGIGGGQGKPIERPCARLGIAYGTACSWRGVLSESRFGPAMTGGKRPRRHEYNRRANLLDAVHLFLAF